MDPNQVGTGQGPGPSQQPSSRQLATISAAIPALSDYLSRRATGGLVEPAADSLLQLVASRLDVSEVGRRVLQGFAAFPNDPAAQADLAAAMAEAMAKDSDFSTALATAVQQPQPVTGGVSSPVTGSGDLTVGGELSNRQGVIAFGGANVDQSRRFKFGTGGIAAIVIGAVVLIGGGTTAAVVVADGGPYDEIAGDWLPDEEIRDGVVLLRIDGDGTWEIEALNRNLDSLGCSGEITRDQAGEQPVTDPNQQAPTLTFHTEEGLCSTLSVTLDGDQLIMSSPEGEEPLRWNRR